MKKVFFILFTIFICFSGLSQKVSETYFYYSKYYAPGVGSYLEFYFTTLGNSVNYIKTPDNTYQASLDYLILFKQKGKIKKFRKYSLSSPPVDDSTFTPSFTDVQRIILDTGNYEIVLTIKDKNNKRDKGLVFSNKINMNHDTSELVFSGIEFVESYTKAVHNDSSSTIKSGYRIIPYVSNYFPENMNFLSFYIEIYNSQLLLGDSAKLLVKYYLEDNSDFSSLKNYVYYNRTTAKPVLVLFPQINIENLPSNKYNIVIEVYNQEGDMIGKQKYVFYRNNPKLDLKLLDTIPKTDLTNSFVSSMTIDSLELYIKYLYPISTQKEVMFASNQLKSKNLNYLQNYFLSFWLKRNSGNPKKEWENYKKQIKIVNDNYSESKTQGYQTERGRVYLQYGRPDDIVASEFEPSAYPYEIWHYYHTIDSQNNVKFVFYNPNIVGKNYTLLHSTAKGEIYTNNWVRILHKRDTPIYDFYNENYGDYYGDKTKDYY